MLSASPVTCKFLHVLWESKQENCTIEHSGWRKIRSACKYTVCWESLIYYQSCLGFTILQDYFTDYNPSQLADGQTKLRSKPYVHLTDLVIMSIMTVVAMLWYSEGHKMASLGLKVFFWLKTGDYYVLYLLEFE